MRYAIFGDIHANLEAFEAVLEHANSLGCQEFVCLGDIVGYNANPSECLEKVRELGCPVVRGNHDDDYSELKTGGNTNPVAKAAQEWTFNKLTEEQRAWLQSLRYVRQVDNFTIVHASLDHPQQWHYVTNKFDAIASIAYQFTQLCFVGHSHVPQIYVRGESVEQHDRLDIIMEEGKKYLVNIGSVGQPRDGDWRASYCVYDTETGQIAIQRIEYDIATAQEKIIAEGLPQSLAARLAEGA